MFGFRVGFSATADLMALFLVRKKSKMAAAAILEKFQMAISPRQVVRSTPCLVLGWVFGDGGSNDATSGSKKSKMAVAAIFEIFKMAISPQQVVRSTLCLVLGWNFWRIQWRYFWFKKSKMAADAILE